MVLGLFVLAFFATVSQVQYTKKRRHPPSLRTQLSQASPGKEGPLGQQGKEYSSQEKKETAEVKPDEADDFFVPHAHLPENSIYRLTMPDVTGNTLDLSQFTGMVSLVVNTACH